MSMGKERKYSKEPVKMCLRSRKDGHQVIYLEIYIEGKRTYERLPDLVLVPETDQKSIKKNDATLKKAEVICRKRNRQLKKELPNNKYVQSQEADVPQLTLFNWIDKYREIQKSRGVRNLSIITRLMKLLELFHDDLPLTDVDKKFCLDFVNFLKNDYKTKFGNPISSKSGFNIVSELSTAMNTAIREGQIQSNPVSKLTPTEKFLPREQVREYLTIDELKMLIQTPCKCEIVKNAFLFACNCGLRRSDVLALKWSDITIDNDVWRVVTRMIKTEKLVYVPLPLQARRWMPPRPTEPEKRNDKVFQKLDVSKIQEYLKPWAESAGITGKNVSFHVSRHTYATMLLTLGADLYTVSKLLGHTSVRHTQRYAKIINKTIDDSIELIDKYL